MRVLAIVSALIMLAGCGQGDEVRGDLGSNAPDSGNDFCIDAPDADLSVIEDTRDDAPEGPISCVTLADCPRGEGCGYNTDLERICLTGSIGCAFNWGDFVPEGEGCLIEDGGDPSETWGTFTHAECQTDADCQDSEYGRNCVYRVCHKYPPCETDEACPEGTLCFERAICVEANRLGS